MKELKAHEKIAVFSLNELLATYNKCLALSQDFVLKQVKEDEIPDSDVWDDFLKARQDLFDFAETSLKMLSQCELNENDENYEERKNLTEKIFATVGEMGLIDDKLAAFLGDNLTALKTTILAMQKSQPVFKRYGQLPSKQQINLIDQTF